MLKNTKTVYTLVSVQIIIFFGIMMVKFISGNGILIIKYKVKNLDKVFNQIRINIYFKVNIAKVKETDKES